MALLLKANQHKASRGSQCAIWLVQHNIQWKKMMHLNHGCMHIHAYWTLVFGTWLYIGKVNRHRQAMHLTKAENCGQGQSVFKKRDQLPKTLNPPVAQLLEAKSVNDYTEWWDYLIFFSFLRDLLSLISWYFDKCLLAARLAVLCCTVSSLCKTSVSYLIDLTKIFNSKHLGDCLNHSWVNKLPQRQYYLSLGPSPWATVQRVHILDRIKGTHRE